MCMPRTRCFLYLFTHQISIKFCHINLNSNRKAITKWHFIWIRVHMWEGLFTEEPCEHLLPITRMHAQKRVWKATFPNLIIFLIFITWSKLKNDLYQKNYQIKSYLRLPKQKESSHPFAHPEKPVTCAVIFWAIFFMYNLVDFLYFKRCDSWSSSDLLFIKK